MKVHKVFQRFFSGLVIFSLVFGELMTISVSIAQAAATSVALVGDLQSELGCTGDWQPECAATELTFDANDQVWQGSFSVPAGNWLYKAALNDDWPDAYPAGFTNLNLNLGSAQTVKFYFSESIPWMANSVSNVIAVAVGSFQSELGCPADWLPDCLRTWMTDTDGDGVYTFVTTAIPAGTYEAKVALDEGWDTSYPGGNISFTVSADNIPVTFSYNSATNAVQILSSLAGDNNVLFSALGHNSRDPLYRNPGGAVPTNTPVKLRLRAGNEDLQFAKVRVWNDRVNTSTVYNMTRVTTGVSLPNDPGPYEFWEVTLPASALPTVYWYRFIVQDGTKTAYYEDDARRTGGWGEGFDASPDNSYQLTIYDPAFSTPDWVKNAVVYQVFPDRFRDGTPANNPTAGGFFYGANDTIVRSNSANWNTPICDPRARPGAVAACANKYSQNFYGGDLQGLIDELDYLQELGVTVIYLNPIFESPSNHKYDTTDFFQIDNNFGTLATFQTLVSEATTRKMKIVLDGVFNHSSSDSVYFDRYDRWNATTSLPGAANFPTPVTPGTSNPTGACEGITLGYSDWYPFFAYVGTPPAPCSNNRDYPKWFGIFDSLPVFLHDNSEVRDYFINNGVDSVGPYWISQGASGWRLDVAPEIDHGVINDPTDDYWEDFRDAVHAINPEAYIVGEEWGNATSWTIGGEWDATMNYQFGAAVMSFWRDEGFTDNDFNNGSSAGPLNPITADMLNERLLSLQERYAPEAFAAMMNLFGSHDTNRVLFLLDNNADGNTTSTYVNPNYDWSEAITRLKGAALVQMTMPGAPTIYYGDEIGLVGPPSFDGSQWQDDPYNRQPYPWLDASGTPYYAHLQSAGGTRGNLLAYYKTLTSARNNNPALRTGSFDPLSAETNSNIYAYGRKMADDSNAAIIVINKAATPGALDLALGGYIPANSALTDLLTGTPYATNGNGDLELTGIPARGGLLLVLDSGFEGQRPAAPVISANAASGQVTISWSAVPNAVDYTIFRSRLGGGGYEVIGGTSLTSYTDYDVSNATRYYYMVKAVASNLLESDFSNEVSAIPAYSIGWANLQGPPTLDHEQSLVTPTVSIYGQVWINGASGGQNGVDPTPGLIAQVGYGNNGSLPTDASWKWFGATFNGNSGNNDEFVGTMIVDSPPGEYDYLYRYSTDGGNSWVYGTLSGLINSTLDSYNAANAGQMTVTAPTDTTAPEAPINLDVTGTTSGTISLAWDTHPNTDGDLYGFFVYRQNITDSEPGFTKIATVAGVSATSFVDDTVETGKQYAYYITAVDNSVNESAPSNTVTATAEMRIVNVTFRVNVPSPTPGTVYIVGGFPAPNPSWNPGGMAMTQTSPGVWQITLELLDGYALEYKYARGTWDKVEKEADGNGEISNRTLIAEYGTDGSQLVEDTIANWRDPIVTSISPANGATGLPATTILTASWNQAMSDPIDPAACFSLTGPGGAVSGTTTYDSIDKTYTFTPNSGLSAGLHTANIAGCKDAAGDIQQVARTWSFRVAATPQTATFRSVAAHDGHIVESGFNTGKGGAVRSDLTVLNLGDSGTKNRQSLVILSFDTSALPDGATITGVELRLRLIKTVKNPAALGPILVDIARPSFGASIDLQNSDFQALASKTKVAELAQIGISNTFAAQFNTSFINKRGTTQFRLRFKLPTDNDSVSDYYQFGSGEYSGFQPVLIVTYTVP